MGPGREEGEPLLECASRIVPSIRYWETKGSRCTSAAGGTDAGAYPISADAGHVDTGVARGIDVRMHRHYQRHSLAHIGLLLHEARIRPMLYLGVSAPAAARVGRADF